MCLGDRSARHCTPWHKRDRRRLSTDGGGGEEPERMPNTECCVAIVAVVWKKLLHSIESIWFAGRICREMSVNVYCCHQKLAAAPFDMLFIFGNLDNILLLLSNGSVAVARLVRSELHQFTLCARLTLVLSGWLVVLFGLGCAQRTQRTGEASQSVRVAWLCACKHRRGHQNTFGLWLSWLQVVAFNTS